MSYLSFEGQSKVDYCVECSIKHSQTAKVLMREALQRAEYGGSNSKGVVDKVRDVVEELSGLEDDTTTTQSDLVSELNSISRQLRKDIYSSKAEVGGATLEQLRELKAKIDNLVEKVYEVRVKEEEKECPNCKTDIKESKPFEQYGVEPSKRRQQLIEEIQKETGEQEKE